MQTRTRFLLLVMLLWGMQSMAQTPAPSTEQMIDQLRTLPRTRSLRNLTVEATPEAERPSLSLSVQFDFDSSRIRPESYAPLGNLATALASPALAASRFLIEGHTDAQGGVDYNRRLSEQRAQAVKALLVGRGADATRLVALGKGSSELLHPELPLSAENRRVKIVNLD